MATPLLLLLSLPSFYLTGWSLSRADSASGRALLRAWHEMHRSAKKAHDFQHGFTDADEKSVFLTAVRGGEVRALALCSPEGKVSCLCHPPEDLEAAEMLVLLLNGTEVDWASLRKQPRWLMSLSFWQGPQPL